MIGVAAHVGRPGREREAEVAPECGHGLGQRVGKAGTFQTLVGGVDVEPESEQGHSVEHLVALDQLLERSGELHDVGIAEDDHVALRECEPGVVRGAEAAAALAYIAPVEIEVQLEQCRAGVIGRPVVDDDDLEQPRPPAVEGGLFERDQRRYERARRVVGADQDACCRSGTRRR